MKHTGKIFAVAAMGLALFMVAAAAVVAIPGQSAHAQGPVTVGVGGTNASGLSGADNSQHSSIGNGASGNSATNSARNDQTQTQNAGSTGTG